MLHSWGPLRWLVGGWVKSWARSLYGTEAEWGGGVEQGVDGGDMERNVKSEQFVRMLRRIRRH